LRANTTLVFCAIDDFIPVSGKVLLGFPEFLDELSKAGIPCVWVTSRSRHQLDLSIRKFGHAAPFIAEGGSGVFLPEDYFHLKAERTIRLGRFTCIPVASVQPAASDALESLAEETGLAVVPLRSLSPRELVQNTGLSRDAAEALRQRDFDELFFFAGATDEDIDRFQKQALHRNFAVRPVDSLWSFAAGSSLASCVSHLGKLYDRALHAHAFSISLGTRPQSFELLPLCDRGIVLTSRHDDAGAFKVQNRPTPKTLPLFASGTWDMALESVRNRQF
jgi:predicted mannosyl-3-phosphoglycerate phosphatase (HAD superfamily)